MPAEITALILRGAAWVNTVVVMAGNVLARIPTRPRNGEKGAETCPGPFRVGGAP